MGILKEKLRKKFGERKYTETILMGEKVLVRQCTMKELDAIISKEYSDDRGFAKELIGFFLDPEDNQPIFDEKYIEESMNNADVKRLINYFYKLNGNDPDLGIGDLEKNLSSPAELLNSKSPKLSDVQSKNSK